MGRPNVSIVLPTYNGAKYLALSVESVLRQTYQDFELIIVDDGSTDTTWDIASIYAAKDTRVKTIRHEMNQNLPNALNTGFAAASGQFFTWTSDDNLYRPNAIEVMANHLTAHENIDIVFTDYAVIDEQGKYLSTRTVGPQDILPIMDLIGACFLYRSEVDRAVDGYDANCFCVEDYAFWLKAYNAGFIFSRIGQILYFYREHIASITGSNFTEVWRRTMELIMVNSRQNAAKIPDEIRMRSFLKCIRYAKLLDDKNSASECMRLAKEINSDAENWTSQDLVDFSSEVQLEQHK